MLHARRRALRWGALSVAALSVLAGLAVGALSYEVADRLVHPPRQLSGVTPADRGIPHLDVVFTSEDGIPLAAWWMPALEPSRGTVVFLHGYGASKAQSLSVAPFLHEAGYDVLAFDFRAHGYSGGTHTTLGLEETRDVEAALQWLRAQGGADPENVALFGWSMGAATALMAAPDLPQVKAVVADSVFASLEGVAARNLQGLTGLPWFPFGALTMEFAGQMVDRDAGEDKPAEAARDVRQPLLVIAGGIDRLAPPSDAEAVAANAGSPAELWLVPDADHTGARAADRAGYEARVLAFFGTHLG